MNENEVESKEPILWGFEGQEILNHDEKDEAIESWLDDIGCDDPLPKTVTVMGYIREKVSKKFSSDAFEIVKETILIKLNVININNTIFFFNIIIFIELFRS